MKTKNYRISCYYNSSVSIFDEVHKSPESALKSAKEFLKEVMFQEPGSRARVEIAEEEEQEQTFFFELKKTKGGYKLYQLKREL